MKAIESVLNHDTLDQMTIKCDIHRTTAFYWRHKIFDRINDLVNKDMLSGEIYLDETLVPAAFEEPIEAKKRGMSKQN